jgi:hypothetical protein
MLRNDSIRAARCRHANNPCRGSVKTIDIPLLDNADCQAVQSAIDNAICDLGLTITLLGTLKKFPGSVHWHVKDGRQPGTLEITLWPEEHRAWLTIQDGRTADWIDTCAATLIQVIEARLQAD